jgi:hypothetical protein
MSALLDSLVSVGMPLPNATILLTEWEAEAASYSEALRPYAVEVRGYSYLIERYSTGGTVKIGPLSSSIDRSPRLALWQAKLEAARAALGLSATGKVTARPLESVFVPVRFG